MKRLLPWLAVAALLAPLAAGHAEPYRSDPAAGARLEASPEVVWVDFTEPIHLEGSWIRVVDQHGKRVDGDDLTVTGDGRPRMQVSLPDLPDGAYSIRWQTYSKSDGHTIKGTIGFAVGGFAPPATTEDAEAEFDASPAAGRALLYAGIILAMGALVYAPLVARRPLSGFRPLLVAGAAAALAGTTWLALDTWHATGLPLGTYVESPGGRGLALRVVLGALVLAATFGRLRPRLLAALWVAFAWLTASLGHVTREGTWGIALEWLHLVGAAVWVGGLLMFARDGRRQDVAVIGRRFSRLALWAMLVVVASGLTLSALLVARIALDDPARLLADSWTWFLLTKVLLVAGMLVLAGLSRYVFLDGDNVLARAVARWRPDWTATGDAKARGLRRAARAEAVLAGLVIVAAGLLLSVSPPSAEALAQADVLERTATGTDYIALLQITPLPTAGASHTMRFFVQDQEQEPLRENSCGTDRCLRVHWQVGDDAGTAQEAVLSPDGDGWWRLEDALFVQPGPTAVTLRVSSAYVFLDELAFEPFVVA